MRNGLAKTLTGLSSLAERPTRIRRRVGSAKAAKISVSRLLLLTNVLSVMPNRLHVNNTPAVLGVGAAHVLRLLLKQWIGPMAAWQAEPIAAAVVLLGLAAAGYRFPARAAMRTDSAELLRQG
jgi:hypothetical protein